MLQRNGGNVDAESLAARDRAVESPIAHSEAVPRHSDCDIGLGFPSFWVVTLVVRLIGPPFEERMLHAHFCSVAGNAAP